MVRVMSELAWQTRSTDAGAGRSEAAGISPALHMVTVDRADPRMLAKHWATAVSYQVDQDWRQVGRKSAYRRCMRPADQRGRRSSGSGAAGRRLTKRFLDWAADDRTAEVQRLLSLGVTVLAEHEFLGVRWTVLADPEGNEFCVSG
jgi:Glyoxalase-like domain